MQIALSKIKQDLTEYLSGTSPTPAAPVHQLESMVCAVYSRETPVGVSYIHLNVELGENVFNPLVIFDHNLPGVQDTAEHKALLEEVLALQQRLILLMEPHSIYVEGSYPHTLTSMLVKAGVWLSHKTSSIFTPAQ